MGAVNPDGTPNVNIPEPATLVGDRTGTPYVNVGDNPNVKESFQVQPDGGAAAAAGGGATVGDPGGGDDHSFYDIVSRLHRGSKAAVRKPASMALGGAGSVGPDYTPADFGYTPSGQTQPVTVNPNYSQPQAPGPPQQGPAQDQWNQQNIVDQNRNQQFDAQGRQYDAQSSALDARGLANREKLNVYGATAATFPVQQDYIAAEQQAAGASATANTQQRAYVQNQQADIQARLQEEQGKQAAAVNLPDLTAVARAKQVRADRVAADQKFDGLSAPQEVVVPEGNKTPLPSGVLAKLETQLDVKTRAADNADKLRSIGLEQARSIVDLANTDATAAALKAKQLGFNVDLARLKVAQAENGAAVADLNASNADLASQRLGIDTNRAGLATNRAEVSLSQLKNPPPGYKVWQDPNGGGSSLVTDQQYDLNVAEQQRKEENLNLSANLQQNIDQAVPKAAAAGQVQNAQDAYYLGHLNDPGTPIEWIVAHATRVTTGANGQTVTNPGLLTVAQAIAALTYKGLSYEQAINAVIGNTSSRGTGGNFSGAAG